MILFFWIIFYTLNVQKSSKKLTQIDNELALLFAAFIFIFGIIFLSKDKLNPTNFCVMNQNEPLCKNKNRDCFDISDETISVVDFGFGKFIEFDKSGNEK